MPPKGTLGMALFAWKAWRRLPPSKRAVVLRQVRRHGPKAAAIAVSYVRGRKR